MRYQRIDLGVLVLVYRNAGALIEEKDILILVHYIELRLYPVKRKTNALALVKLGEELLGEKALYHVALKEHRIVFGALAVDLDLLRADRFV